MKIKKQKSRKTLIIAITAGFLVLLAAAIFWLVSSRSDEETSTSPSTDEANSQQLEDGKTKPTNPKENPPTPTNTGQSSEDVPVNTATTLTITELVQQGSEVRLNSALSGADGGGTCVATFTNSDGRPVVREFASAGADGCGPLTIPSIEFSALGEWELTLRFYNQGEQTVTKQTIIIT